MQIRSRKEVLGLASCHIRKKSLQVHLHRVGGGVFVGRRPPPTRSGPLLVKFEVEKGKSNMSERGGKSKSEIDTICGIEHVVFPRRWPRKIRHRVTRCLHTHTHTHTTKCFCINLASAHTSVICFTCSCVKEVFGML